jgi:hypothetical protein
MRLKRIYRGFASFFLPFFLEFKEIRETRQGIRNKIQAQLLPTGKAFLRLFGRWLLIYDNRFFCFFERQDRALDNDMILD